MQISSIPFQTTDWTQIKSVVHKGEKGEASWKTLQVGDIRVRMVEYSAGYVADHWCDKGHIIYCIEGEMITRLKNDKKFLLTAGMTYQVGDGMEPHMSTSVTGCKLFIVD